MKKLAILFGLLGLIACKKEVAHYLSEDESRRVLEIRLDSFYLDESELNSGSFRVWDVCDYEHLIADPRICFKDLLRRYNPLNEDGR